MKWAFTKYAIVCEIIRCKLGAELGPCCYHRHLLFLNRDRRRDTGGAHEIHYFYCQEKNLEALFLFLASREKINFGSQESVFENSK